MAKKLLFTLLMISVTGFSQQKSINNLNASPNPFISQTTISFDSSEEQGVYLVVKNILGKTVFKQAYYTSKGNRKITFNKENLKAGVYIYAIESRKNIISKRFVIK